MATVQTPPAFPPGDETAFFGHPRGLSTLFFTEMWERFSYYGMRALLVLFMTAPLTGTNPGLAFAVGKSTAIYGIYTAMVYLVALPGGWIADKVWGQRKAVFVGGCIIAAGHFSMAIPIIETFYLGLALIVVGTGLLKPNVSTMVGELYPEGGARRDAGFSVFYMGINAGAFLGTLLCGYIGEGINFHWGFSLAGIGMVFGLLQYKLGGRHLGPAGLLKSDEPTEVISARHRRFMTSTVIGIALVGLFAFAMATGLLPITISQLAQGLASSIFIMSGIFFAYLFIAGGLTPVEKKRLVVIIWLYLLSAVFWAGFEQAGSSMNLFGRDLTDRFIGGWEMPASWLQNVNPVMIIILAPIFGMLWTWLGARHANPSVGVKFALGLVGLAAGFFVLAWGAANVTEANKASMVWLTVTYFLHTSGELCLSPVGLSSMTKLAPEGRTGQMMGVWFIGAALGNVVAGLFAGGLEQLAPSELFWNVGVFAGVAAVIAFALSPVVKKLTAGAE